MRIQNAAIIVSMLTMMSAPGAARAQLFDRLSNPRFDVPITHPPQVALKGVTKVSVLDFTGDDACGPELTIRLTQAISESGKFEIIDRSNIQRILDEQGLQGSSAVDQASAVKLGRILGPAAILTGRITRCSVTTSPVLRAGPYKDRRGRVYYRYMRRTSAQLVASVSLIDLSTAKVYAGQLLDVADTAVAISEDGEPEPPSRDEVLTKVYARAVQQAQSTILPWTETVSVTVFDDDKCGLKQSANLIKAGQFAAAAEALKASIANSCNAPKDTKLLAHAHYNLGIALAYSERPEEGLKELQTSAGLRGGSLTNEAIAAVTKMIRANQERQIKEASAVELGPSAGAKKSEPSAPLTNKDIVAMTRAKVPAKIIVAKIKGATSCKFDTSTEGLIALSQAGASEEVILAINEAKCGN